MSVRDAFKNPVVIASMMGQPLPMVNITGCSWEVSGGTSAFNMSLWNSILSILEAKSLQKGQLQEDLSIFSCMHKV